MLVFCEFWHRLAWNSHARKTCRWKCQCAVLSFCFAASSPATFSSAFQREHFITKSQELSGSCPCTSQGVHRPSIELPRFLIMSAEMCVPNHNKLFPRSVSFTQPFSLLPVPSVALHCPTPAGTIPEIKPVMLCTNMYKLAKDAWECLKNHIKWIGTINCTQP